MTPTINDKNRLSFSSKTSAKKAPDQQVDETAFQSFCMCTEQEAVQKIGTTLLGLTSHDAKARLAEFGPNKFASSRARGIFGDLVERLKDPLVIQLLVICIVCFFMHDIRSVVVVGGMLILSVALSSFQERRSIKAAEDLKKLVQNIAIVLRDGRETEIDLSDVVPGDIVVMAAGSIIPADLRIIAAKDFFVNQSAMTGESMPVEKFSLPPKTAANDPFALPNAAFQGSTVVSGTARGVVIVTGAKTFLGTISQNIAKVKVTTSFDKGIKSFVWLMVRFMLVMVSLVFLIVGLTKHNWVEALLFGLSVAVGLTPEMLPMIITVCLSKGALAMSKKKVIVKQLKSIQNFGAMNILCTDKTGTLTQDKIVLERYVDVSNRPSEDVLRYAYMNSYYQTGLRNLLDKAILAHEDLDVERSCRKVDELPFDFERKRMSVVIAYEGTNVLICKGAVESVNAVADRYQIDDEIHPMFDVIRNDIMEEYQRLSSDGFRVLAVGYREFPKEKETFAVADEQGLVMLGYLAFFDPPKESAAKALVALRGAGVKVKVLTGDNELVTKSVCANVGLEPGKIVVGSQLAGMDSETFAQTARETNVFAQLSPLQKEAIIAALRKQGNTVGFLGDGINDAPALKAADVGISVDTAVDVAKESADIILLERSLLVLEEGIIEGRRVFANVVKYIKMGASSNFGNMFSVLGGAYFLPFLPMAPIQVLLNNLLYDISQTSIPTDNVDDSYLAKPQNWDIGFIRRFMMFIGPISSLFDYATFFLMLFFFKCWNFTTAATPQLRTYYEQLFHTGWFIESLFTQTMIVYVLRTNGIPFITSKPSPGVLLTTIAVVLIAVYLPFSPFASTLGFVPLPALFWPWLLLFVALYAVLAQLVKSWFTKRFGA
jgi:P-type Mg2+ transporter